MESDPSQINLEKVLFLLISNRNLIAAVRLCSLKSKHVKDLNEIEECHNYVLEIIESIISSINQKAFKPYSQNAKLILKLLDPQETSKKD